LSITPDARAGSMGDIGVATESDVFSQYWNPAKYAFAFSKAGIGLTLTPWLSSLVDDVFLTYVSGFYKIGDSDNIAIGSSFRYFSLGEIALTQYDAGSPDQYKDAGSTRPYELAFDASIALKFTQAYSQAVAFRYIFSDLGTTIRSQEGLLPANAVAVDIAGFYNKYIMLGRSECLLGLGYNISNIGTKVSYDNGENSTFLPTNLRIGASLLYPLDDYNTIAINADVNKYLIPTPPVKKVGMTPEEEAIYNDAKRVYDATTPISGIFKSFSDAPGGFKEELQEIAWSVGAEYAYDNKFFVRGGYFYENPNKGNRQYFGLGAGFRMTALQLDVAYLISANSTNPLDKTWRFSLSFDMDGLRNLMR